MKGNFIVKESFRNVYTSLRVLREIYMKSIQNSNQSFKYYMRAYIYLLSEEKEYSKDRIVLSVEKKRV